MSDGQLPGLGRRRQLGTRRDDPSPGLDRSAAERDVREEVAAVALVRHGAGDAPGDHLVPPRGDLRDVRRLLRCGGVRPRGRARRSELTRRP